MCDSSKPGDGGHVIIKAGDGGPGGPGGSILITGDGGPVSIRAGDGGSIVVPDGPSAPKSSNDMTPEAKAILFIQERLKTTGKLPAKKAVADLLEVSDRTMRNWLGFKVAYAELERKHGSARRRPRGEKTKDGTLEAWQD